MTKKWFPVLGFTGFVTLIVGFLIQDCVLLLPKEIWLPGTQSFSIFGKIRFIYRMAYFFASKPVVAEFYWQISSMCLPCVWLVSCSDTGGQEVIWGEQLFCVTWHDFLREGAPWPHLHLQPKLQRHCQQSRSQYQSWLVARGWSIDDTDKICHVFFCKFLYTQSAKITTHSLIAVTLLRREAVKKMVFFRNNS